MSNTILYFAASVLIGILMAITLFFFGPDIPKETKPIGYHKRKEFRDAVADRTHGLCMVEGVEYTKQTYLHGIDYLDTERVWRKYKKKFTVLSVVFLLFLLFPQFDFWSEIPRFVRFVVSVPVVLSGSVSLVAGTLLSAFLFILKRLYLKSKRFDENQS